MKAKLSERIFKKISRVLIKFRENFLFFLDIKEIPEKSRFSVFFQEVDISLSLAYIFACRIIPFSSVIQDTLDIVQNKLNRNLYKLEVFCYVITS